MIGLIGQKIGMTRMFTDNISVPITIVEVMPNRISQIKTIENDGYCAVQLTYGIKNKNNVCKPLLGHYSKAKIQPGTFIKEFVIQSTNHFALGQMLNISDIFNEGDLINISSISKGKGFSGTIKRHGFHMQDASHGNSLSHRAPGSIGQNQTPGRVFKGKKMAGHMGNKRFTIKHLKLVRIDINLNLLFIKGSIPGHSKAYVEIKHK